jgi:hypothetical protein
MLVVEVKLNFSGVFIESNVGLDFIFFMGVGVINKEPIAEVTSISNVLVRIKVITSMPTEVIGSEMDESRSSPYGKISVSPPIGVSGVFFVG